MNLIKVLLPLLVSSVVKGSSGVGDEVSKGGCGVGKFRYKDNLCYDLVFQASSEYKEVVPGQQLPKGLHVQIDMTTGIKRAKLDEGNVTDDKANLPQLELDSQSLASMGDVPKLNYHLNLLANLDDNSKLLNSLEGIEELSHDLDLGIRIVSHKEGFNKLVLMLNPKYPTEIRILAATVIGSAVQNNLKASALIEDSQLIANLVDYLSMENLDPVINRLLFTISSIARTQPTYFEKFIDLDLLDILRQQLQLEQHSQTTLKKILVLLADCFDLNLHSNASKQTKLSFKQKQLDSWLNILQELLMDTKKTFTLDFKSKLIGALDKLVAFDKGLKPNSRFTKFTKEYQLSQDEQEDEEFLMVFDKVKSWAKH